MSLRDPWLLAADLDGTLIPLDDDARTRAGVQRFRALVEAKPRLILAYVTGRDRVLAEAGIRATGLPLPDLLATDVGTELYRLSGDTFRPDPEYADLMRRAMGGVSAERIRALLEAHPGLEAQEAARQRPHKVSFYVDPALGERPLREGVAPLLAEAGADVSLVYSRDPVKGVGLLDVLPRGVAKDAAVRFLHDRTGVAEERLVYAGDSGNDRAAMLAGYRVVVVGNAPEPFKRELRRSARELGCAERLYFAREPYAAGVVEGLVHWGLA
ncbi:MAG: HAD-IIB family hydrolase [Longimicrobiales bacterium]|nr:HAD-IIB family hydrolase [Longimicrobiales bacterium]